MSKGVISFTPDCHIFTPECYGKKSGDKYSLANGKDSGVKYQPMSQLLLPVAAAQNMSSAYRLPPLLQPYQMQGSTGTIIDSNEVTAFVQELIVNGFTYGYHMLQVRQPVQMQFICVAGSGILHYPLKGSMNIHQPDEVPMLKWSSQQYRLGYHPAGSTLTIYFEPGHYHFFQVAFSLNLLQHILQTVTIPHFQKDLVHTHSVFTAALPVSKRVSELIRLTLAQAYHASPDMLYLNNSALQLTSRLVHDCRMQERRRFWEQKKEIQLTELEAYIMDHLDTENKQFITLAACARKTGTSTFYFKKLFRQQYGLSPAAFIRKKRMEKAMQLITGTSFPAGDIYQEVGYENFSSFSRTFRAYFGHPPSYYRKT